MGMLVHDPMGMATGKGIGSNNDGSVTGTDATGPRFATMTGAGIGKGNDTALMPHGVAAGGVGAQFQVEHPPHGLMGGGALQGPAALVQA